VLDITDPRGVAAGRTLVGLTMMAQPSLVPSLLGVSEEAREGTGFLVQMLGAREIALGLGAQTARNDRRRWLLAGILSDAVDAVVVARAIRSGRARRVTGLGTVTVAAAATAIQVRALRE
jgi:hypothetical protein